MVKKYTVEIEETLTKQVVIMADTPSNAEAMVRSRYKNGEFVLDASNYFGTQFSTWEVTPCK